MGYVMTNRDRMAINELLQVTHSFQLQGNWPKGVEEPMEFSLMAPGRTNSWFSSKGLSVEEAVDNWYSIVSEAEGILIRKGKLETTSVYEAKAEVIDINEAQFYG